MNNTEIFNATVALVFDHCFKSFPVRINLDSLELAVQIAELYPDEILTEDKNDLNYETMIVFESIRWLIDSGYIWSKTSTVSLGYIDVVLTPQGLDVLNSVPESLNSKESIGKLLSSGIKKIGADSVNQIINTIISIGLAKTLS
ncbi:MAG: hypothetical protein EOM46_07085 [Gammaproteobacteria bacterium]|nr:hypothetical protein [Gammaproteobacteria bacterium]